MTEPRDQHVVPPELAAELAAGLAAPAQAPGDRRAQRARLLERARRAPPRGLTTQRADEGGWRPFLPKVSIRELHREGDTLTYLLRLDAGAIIVPHEHPEDEECIVLAGEVRIGDDIVARTGDYHLAPRGVPHGAITSEHGALLFLRGAVPKASQVRWAHPGTIAAFAPGPLRKFVERW